MPRIALPLTVKKIETTIQNHKTHDRVTLADGMCPGLSLRIGPMGANWALQARCAGTRRRIALGPFPKISLANARKLASQTRSRLESYPTSQKNSPHSAGFVGLPTLSSLLEVYGDMVGKSQRSWAASRRKVRHVLADVLDEPIATLQPRKVQSLIDRHPSKSNAAACIGALRPILKWAAKRTDIPPGLKEIEAPKNAVKVRQRVLSEDELRRVLKALTFEGFDAAIRMMLLTACRREEVSGASWEEFDLAARTWTIPAARRKTNVELVVPLTADAATLVGCCGPNLWGFKVAPHWERWQKNIFERTETKDWHRHDLRRTAATVLGSLGEQPHVIESVLGHTHAHSGLASVYNKSRYEPEHRRALERLSEYYLNIII
jgi:integrase